jgi:hypothetical protein
VCARARARVCWTRPERPRVRGKEYPSLQCHTSRIVDNVMRGRADVEGKCKACSVLLALHNSAAGQIRAVGYSRARGLRVCVT